MICSVRDLSADQKSAIESLLGHAVSENDRISILPFSASTAPEWLESIQQDARQAGLDKMTIEEIDAEIAATRLERSRRTGQ